jgi:hypothetical protein
VRWLVLASGLVALFGFVRLVARNAAQDASVRAPPVSSGPMRALPSVATHDSVPELVSGPTLADGFVNAVAALMSPAPVLGAVALVPVAGPGRPVPVAEPARPVLVASPRLDSAPNPLPAGGNAAQSSSTGPIDGPATARDDERLRGWPYMPFAAPAAPDGPAGAAAATDLVGWGPPPAPSVDPRRFTEAHWQGIEVIPNTPGVARALKIPEGAQGVIIDDVTLPADLQGFVAGDLVTHVNGVPTPDLTSFVGATDLVREWPHVRVDLLRNGEAGALWLVALKERLGTANGETASMIPPGARMPHPYRGPCTNCHRIGTTGTLAIDQGDMAVSAAPAIRADAVRPHRDRGPCRACHQILP